jgi:hypothetical protein
MPFSKFDNPKNIACVVQNAMILDNQFCPTAFFSAEFYSTTVPITETQIISYPLRTELKNVN